ncbi:peptidase family M1-domain-containing protein [Phellopilus nigrolimitatus]|nr:peptidase family M1-domain-containing protein [Phellopilus nigrolimitatus]
MAPPGSISTSSNVPINEHRLPLDVKPLHYDVTIRTDLEKLAFDGVVVIDLEILKETSSIVFHTSNLNIKDVTIHSDALKIKQVPTSQSLDPVTECAILKFPTAFPMGSKAQLEVKFDAELTGDLMGYYLSSWEKDGKKQYYALTQFEPTAARRAFPCWDEPLLKATYSVTLISRKDTVNLSNMPSLSEEPYTSGNCVDSEKWKITKFDRTPPMSSYLVAFANGHFDYLESSYVSPLSGKTRPLRIYATSDFIHQAEFALDIKRKVLPLYEQMFDVEYPLPKLDTLIASDFDAGAMENWGLIIGCTTAFCLDPEKVGVAAQKQIATTQSHEVAHMWFGDITTMAWWDNLYLNEGTPFVSILLFISDEIFPEWKVYSEFIIDHLNGALNMDAKLSSHPIEVDCPDANQINQIFDDLSYSKAGSVLRMLSAFVGEETFLKGVSIYLKKHLYANSVSKDLWDGIGEASGLDIAIMMDNWVSKMGFPLLTVTEKAGAIHVRQDRFLETGPAADKDNKTIWQIPLNIASVDSDGKLNVDRTLLKDKEITIPLDTSKPFKLNCDTTGVYRVLYSPERLAKIGAEAAKKDSVFSLDDRIGLVNDVFALSNAGFGNVSVALALIQNLRHEEEFLPWQGISDNLGDIANIFWENKQAWHLLKEFRSSLYAPIVDKLGYDYSKSDTADTKQLRSLAISRAAASDEPAVVKELSKRFAEYLKTGDDAGISLDLEKATYTTVVKHGGRAEYDAIKAIYKKPKTPTTHLSTMLNHFNRSAALCAATDPNLIDETFNIILTEARDQDVYRFIGKLSGNTVTRRQMAQWFKANYEEIYKRFSANTQLSDLVSYSFKKLSSEADAKDTEEFFKDKDVSKYNLSLSQALDTIRAHAAVLERSTDDVVQWLEEWSKESKR